MPREVKRFLMGGCLPSPSEMKPCEQHVLLLLVGELHRIKRSTHKHIVYTRQYLLWKVNSVIPGKDTFCMNCFPCLYQKMYSVQLRIQRVKFYTLKPYKLGATMTNLMKPWWMCWTSDSSQIWSTASILRNHVIHRMILSYRKKWQIFILALSLFPNYSFWCVGWGE